MGSERQRGWTPSDAAPPGAARDGSARQQPPNARGPSFLSGSSPANVTSIGSSSFSSPGVFTPPPSFTPTRPHALTQMWHSQRFPAGPIQRFAQRQGSSASPGFNVRIIRGVPYNFSQGSMPGSFARVNNPSPLGPMGGRTASSSGPQLVVGGPPSTSHMRSAFHQSESARLAGLIRSGATESTRDLNRGILGPALRLNGNGGYFMMPPPELPPIQPPDGPMPPPVPGFDGRPRPRFGRFVPTPNPSESLLASLQQNLSGPAAAFIGVTDAALPHWFHSAVSGQNLPTLEEVMQVLPLIDACKQAAPSSAAVIKVQEPPYLTNRPEILATVNRSSQICMQPPGSPFYAVHIITNRFDGRTMDAYVEIGSTQDAARTLQALERRVRGGRPLMIRDRPCFIKLSSQEELMEEMFPRAKFVGFKGGSPQVSSETPEFYAGQPSTGFDGFFDPEELSLMARYAETPQRAPYLLRCQVRIWESLISALHKYPWFDTEHILIRERNQMFKVTITSLRALIRLLANIDNNQQGDQTKPTPAILQELIVATLTCPGFTESQKFEFASSVADAGWQQYLSPRGMNLHFGGTHQYACTWPFQALAMKPGTPEGLVMYLADLLKQALNRDMLFPMDTADLHLPPGTFPSLDIDYKDTHTLADLARVERRYVESMLRLVLTRPSQAATFGRPRFA